MSNRFPNVGSLLYLGTQATQPPNMLFLKDRDPNQFDNQAVSIGDLCLREDTQGLWYLGSLAGDANSEGILANWIPFTAGMGLTSLRADDNLVAAPALGIVNTYGNGINLFTTAAIANTTTLHLRNVGVGSVISTVDGMTGENTLSSITGAANTVLTGNGIGVQPTFQALPSSAVSTKLRGNDAVIVPPTAVTGIIETVGSNNIETDGDIPSNTLTIRITNIGLIGTLPEGIVYFTEDAMTKEDTLTGIENGNPGDVLTINGFGIPEFAAPGVGGTVTSVSGGDNLNTTGGITSPIVVVNLDTSILQPSTNADGSEGVYALGTTDYETDRFLHAAGDITNTFVGLQSGNFATITGAAEDNTGAGNLVLSGLTSGQENSGFGAGSLDTITTGSRNSALGRFAGSSLTLGDSNNILIGHFGTAGDNHRIRIGRQGTGNLQQDSTFIVGIYAQTPPTLTPRVVTVNSAHQLQAIASALDGTVLTLVGGIPTWQAGGGGGAVLAGQNITINPVNVVNLNTSVHLLSTTSDGLTGVIAIGPNAIADGPPAGGNYITDRFVHRFGTRNTFLGYQSGNMTLTTGSAQNNSAFGYQSLLGLTTGISNTAGGTLAGGALTSGGNNALFGANSGVNITTASNNTIVGGQAGTVLTTGGSNTIIGKSAATGINGTTSASNIVIGVDACSTNFNANFNTIVGPTAALTMRGDYNVILGNTAGSAITNAVGANSNIYISNTGANENNTTRIGTDGAGTGQQTRAFMAGIYSQIASGTNNRVVVVNDPGQLRAVTPGLAGDVLTLTGVGLLPTWLPPSGGGGGGTIITPFTTNGTWNKNVNTKMVTILGWNGGSGGGSGSRDASNITNGGQGGGAGGCFYLTVPAFFFSSSEAVVVGTGGLGGSSSATTLGNDGDEGTNTTIGNIGCPTPSQDKGTGTAFGGGAGANRYSNSVLHGLGSPIITETFGNYYQGNQTATSFSGSVGFGGGVTVTGATITADGQSSGINNSFTTTQAIPGQATRYYAMLSATGGGGGGTGNAGINSRIAGGNGGVVVNSAFYNVSTSNQPIILAGGIGGTVSGANGGTGNSSVTAPAVPTANAAMHGFLVGGTGGGGGAFGVATNGGRGGNGGFPGGAGGGGGGCTGANNGGAGGNGANGYLLVIEQL